MAAVAAPARLRLHPWPSLGYILGTARRVRLVGADQVFGGRDRSLASVERARQPLPQGQQQLTQLADTDNPVSFIKRIGEAKLPEQTLGADIRAGLLDLDILVSTHGRHLDEFSKQGYSVPTMLFTEANHSYIDGRSSDVDSRVARIDALPFDAVRCLQDASMPAAKRLNARRSSSSVLPATVWCAADIILVSFAEQFIKNACGRKHN